MGTKAQIHIDRKLAHDDLILITGAGGFIGGAMARYFHDLGYTRIRGVDRKPVAEWCQRVPGVECLSMDLGEKQAASRAVEGVAEVYNFAGGEGGVGFVERSRVECLRTILINTHLIDCAWRAGARRYFLASSACVYNTNLQKDHNARALKESDAYPAMAVRGYGWEKLISEMFCQEYWAERGFETHIARFFNIYGPYGTRFGERENAPAAISRRVIEAKHTGRLEIEIWGDGAQTRSFCFIGDCVLGVDLVMHSDALIATPVNLGSSELISVDRLVTMVEEIAGVRLRRTYDLNAPRGVAGRNSDNTFIQSALNWQPCTPLRAGMEATYAWIEQQYCDRKAGGTLSRIASDREGESGGAGSEQS